MNQFFYSTGIFLMGLGIKLASFFHPKAKLWINGRKNIFQTLTQNLSPSDKVIWMHASSLGEYEQGLPVLKKLQEEFPNHKYVISFFSPSGFEIIKNKNQDSFIFYLPLDTKKNANNLLKILHPELAIFVKYDFWYNLLQELNKQKVKTIFISAIFRKNQIYFNPKGKWLVNILQNISHFFVQNEDSKKLLQSINIRQTTISGDTRFDRVKQLLHRNNQLPWLANFKQNKTLLVAGSTWIEDDEMLINFINNYHNENMKIVIVPHNMNTKHFEKIKKQIQYPSLLYSEIEKKGDDSIKVLIVDTIGILTKIYAYADIAYVGGGFGKEGVHNVLEPAVFGVPVIYGPVFDKFIEAKELLEYGGAEIIRHSDNFTPTLASFFQSSPKIKEMGMKAQKYILQKPDSTKTILEYIKSERYIQESS